ncbi:MAG TPA: glycosyl hydrolase [Clostridiaceae bacterium]
MKNLRLRKVTSVLMALAMTFTLLPSNRLLVKAGGTTPTIIYSNDFEDATKLPDGKTAADLVANVNGSKALSYDYTFSKDKTWDQKADININAEYTAPIAAGATLALDILLPKDSTFNGAIQIKGASKMGSDWAWTEADSLQSFTIDKFTTVDNYKLHTVTFTFGNQITLLQGLHALCLQFIGNACDYTGKLYIDNIKLIEGNVVTPVDNILKTVEPTVQTKVTPSSLTIPSSVSLVDASASAKTASLYAYLQGVGKSDKVIFGHQNDTSHKAGTGVVNTSDTKDMTGSNSGVVAIDALSLTGAELTLPAGEPDLVTASADICAAAASEGSIISLSAHMPNFAGVVAKGKTNGKYDYTGYTPNVTSGDVVQRIMPGGDLNEAFTGYLDMVANFGNQLGAKGVPVLFRPFHENSGSWFWWGAAECDQAAFKDLWRYTVEYLRDVKQVHNFLYVYSPGGPVETEASYLDRYPGDDYVDVMAFDMYNNNPTTTDNFATTLANSMKVIDGVAAKHNKITTVSETGMIVGSANGILVSGNQNLDWFQNVLDAVSSTNASYFLTWANFGKTDGFFEPYMTDPTHGHEMINNFISFYNDPKSVFADGIGDYSTINVANTKSATTNTTGYITTPYSGFRMLAPTVLKAIVKNTDKPVKFVLKDSKGVLITNLNAIGTGSDYSAQVTSEILNNIAPNYGSIELTIDGQVFDTIKIMYNIHEVVSDSSMVDDFESYLGNDALLASKWSASAGAGCSVTPMLTGSTDEHNKGDYGLAFKYKTNTAAGEGWAGITKSLTEGTDWSAFNAYQLWIKPDGNGQKLVIQITSNGEDFEVFLPEFAATKEAKLVTIPFSKLVGKSKGTFDPAKVTKVGIYCNTIIPTGQTAVAVDSTIYFDDISAVKSSFTDINFADVETGTGTTGSTTDQSSTVQLKNISNDIIAKINVASITSVVIDAKDNSKISKDIFTALKGKDKTLTIVTSNATWVFNGKDIINPLSSDIDLSLKAVSAELQGKEAAKVKAMLGKDVPIASFSFNYDGTLPGTGKVTLSLGLSFANKAVSIYRYFAVKNTYEKVTDATADANGYITISLNHCSDYFAVEKSVATNLPQTGLFVDQALILEIGSLLILFGVVFIILSKRRRKESI